MGQRKVLTVHAFFRPVMVFDFGVCINLRVFVFLAVGFRFEEEMPAIFWILYPIRIFWNGNCSFEDFRR